MRSIRLRSIAGLLGFGILAACVVVREVTVTELPRTAHTTAASPVKVHLHDGSVVSFADGVIVTSDSIVTHAGNHGVRYGPTLELLGVVDGVALEDVLGAEVYRESVDEGESFMYSVGATLLTKGVITMALAGGDVSPIKAIFGSCPTIYSDSAGSPVLEAESFSSSIAPLLARRDVDLLRTQPDERGRLTLEVRNEALETHYIDHLQLVEVTHAADEDVLAVPFGHPVAVRALMGASVARDRAGRDVRAELYASDGQVFASSPTAFARATDMDVEDWIDLTLARPDADSVAVVMRVRSSLLTTHLFYEHMLARPGAHAFDWLATDLSRIATVAQFGRWYGAHLTLRVQVLGPGGAREIVRLADIGPIAFRDIAVMVPVDATQDSVRIRLAFMTDQWRIDRVAFGLDARRVPGRALEAVAVRGSDGEPRPAVLGQIGGADERFIITQPGDRFFVDFDAGVSDLPRTYLLGAQGYYIEWIRGEWLQRAAGSAPFDPAAVRPARVLEEWLMQRDSMEQLFYSVRIPVV